MQQNNINTQKGIEKILFFCVYRDKKKVLGVLMSTVLNDLTSGVYTYLRQQGAGNTVLEA